MTITCVITDDEPMARKGLQSYVERVDFLSLTGVCEDAIQLNTLLKTQQPDLLLLASFFVKSEKQMRKIYLRDILFVEALENYVSIYTTSGRVLTHSTLKRIGESLPDDQFLQTHKSYIINADRVDLVEGNRLRIESYQIPIARNLRDVVFKRILKNTL